jgi:hypothetical protein
LDCFDASGATFVESDKAAEVGTHGKKYSSRWLSVASSASSFLIVAFDRGWDSPVNDSAHVTFVNTHTKSVRGNNDVAGPGHKRVLGGFTRGRDHARVVTNSG